MVNYVIFNIFKWTYIKNIFWCEIMTPNVSFHYVNKSIYG